MIDVSEVVSDPDLCSSFTILRTTGTFEAGGWVPNTPTVISAFGAVRNTSGKEVDMIPEADRIHESITIRTVTQIFETSEDLSQTSDIFQWQGDKYRLMNVKNYSEQGYWFALGVRMAGQ